MKATDAKIKLYKKGSMLAFVDVEIDGVMWINGWKLFQGKDGREFDLGAPSEQYKDKDGSMKYKNSVFFNFKGENSLQSKTVSDQIRDLVVNKYKQIVGSQPDKYTQPQNGYNAPQSKWEENDEIPF